MNPCRDEPGQYKIHVPSEEQSLPFSSLGICYGKNDPDEKRSKNKLFFTSSYISPVKYNKWPKVTGLLPAQTRFSIKSFKQKFDQTINNFPYPVNFLDKHDSSTFFQEPFPSKVTNNTSFDNFSDFS